MSDVLAGFATAMTRPMPMGASTIVLPLPTVTVYVYRPSTAASVRNAELVRAEIVASMLAVDPFDRAVYSRSKFESWIWTLFEMCVPGSPATILANVATVDEVVLTQTQIATASDLSGLGTPSPLDPFLPGIATHALGLRITPELAGMFLGLYIFAIAKTPTKENLVAFTERRPKAVAGKAGMEDDTLTVFKSFMPTLGKLKAFAGYFNMRPAYRKAMTMEVIRWIENPMNTSAEAIVTHVKLWKGAGMTHLMMVKNLVQSYGPILRQIAPLVPELAAAGQAYAAFAGSTDQFKEYTRVVNGDRAQYGQSGSYFGLVVLARDLLSRVDARFEHYAEKSTGSPYMEEFERLCNATVPPVFFPKKGNTAAAL